MANKYKQDHNRTKEDQKLEASLAIANELAEQNRLKRLDLEMKYRTNAIRNLYRTYKGEDGKTFQVPPDQKQKDEYVEEIKAIKKELRDHAVEIDDQEEEKTSG